MIVSVIVAVAQNNVIGRDNDLIWHLPADMNHFKKTTAGHCVITGRKNYESIPEKFRPLPNRTNIVITRQEDYYAPGAIVVPSLSQALKEAEKSGDKEVFVIGGGEIYKQSISLVDKLYITRVYENFEGDTYFPELDIKDWEEVRQSEVMIDEKSKVKFAFFEYRNKKKSNKV